MTPPSEATLNADAPDITPSDAATEAAVSDALLDAVPDAPCPLSTSCGDGIRSPTEECDDGNADDTDFCTSSCTVRDRVAVGPTDTPPILGSKTRKPPQWEHVAAAGANGAAFLFTDGDAQDLRVQLFRKDGTRLSDAGIPVDDEKQSFAFPYDVSLVALPADRYVAFWVAVNGDGDGLGVVMRTIDGATGALGATQVVDTSTYQEQRDVDAVWTGSEIVAAWTHPNGDFLHPHVRYRTFDDNLQPSGDDALIAPSSDNESRPVLAAFNGGWAAAWLERNPSTFEKTYVVQASGTEWRVGSFFIGTDLQIELTALDSQHLLLVFDEPEHLADAGLDVPRLYGAVLDAASPGVVSPFRIEALAPAFAGEPLLQQIQPSLTFAGGSAYLSFAEGNDMGLGWELALKEIPWRTDGGAPSLDLSVPEIPLAHDPERQSGYQFSPYIAAAPWSCSGSLFAIWEDDSRTFSTLERRPDIAAEVIPLPVFRKVGDAGAEAGSVVDAGGD